MSNYRNSILKFKNWLQQQGCEILPNTNEHEAIRFKGSEFGVKYKSGRFSGEYAKKAYICFQSGSKWDGGPISTGRKNTYIKEKKALIKRDGTACFYCGLLMGDDITLEHLIPLTAGGKNNLSNMVLAHDACNNKMGFKPLVDKINYALKTRVELLTSVGV